MDVVSKELCLCCKGCACPTGTVTTPAMGGYLERAIMNNCDHENVIVDKTVVTDEEPGPFSNGITGLQTISFLYIHQNTEGSMKWEPSRP